MYSDYLKIKHMKSGKHADLKHSVKTKQRSSEKILSKYLDQNQISNISKQEFMNHSMLLYSSSRDAIETLARTYEKLRKGESQLVVNHGVDVSRNSLASNLSKESKVKGELSQITKLSSSKMKSAALQKSKVGCNKLGKNVSVNLSLKCDKSVNNHTLIKYISSHGTKKNSRLEEKKSLILTLASRNKGSKVNKGACIKSKSISEENVKQFKIEKKINNYYRCIGAGSGSQNFVSKRNNSQKDEEISNTEYFLVNMSKEKKDQRSNSAMLVSEMVCSTPRNITSIIKDKSTSPITIDIQKLQNLGCVPHGEEAEKINNEERLNIQTECTPLKNNGKMIDRNKEKSIDLSGKSGSYHGCNQNILTAKLLNSNKLSKYLTTFICGKDFRSSEERELDKCTFQPKFFVKHRRYKTIKGKITGYINGESTLERPKNVSIYLGKKSKQLKIKYSEEHSSSRSESKYSIVSPKSALLLSNPISGQSQNQFSSPITKKNFALQISKINGDTSNLASVLKFGYTHKYQSNFQVDPCANLEVKSTKFLSSPTNTMTISFNELSKIKFSSSQLTSPQKQVKSKRVQSINQNGIGEKVGLK